MCCSKSTTVWLKRKVSMKSKCCTPGDCLGICMSHCIAMSRRIGLVQGGRPPSVISAAASLVGACRCRGASCCASPATMRASKCAALAMRHSKFSFCTSSTKSASLLPTMILLLHSLLYPSSFSKKDVVQMYTRGTFRASLTASVRRL